MTSLHLGNLSSPAGTKHRPKRKGCGIGSGHGKTSTRGHKGEKARGTVRPGFVGGQTPLQRRMRKLRGISKTAYPQGRFRKEYAMVNLGQLDRLEASTEVTPDLLLERKIIRKLGAGLRVLGITHYGTGRYAGGTSTDLGLTDLGVALLAEMERLGMILDITHCSDPSFWQALERFQGPVLASHNNCRALVPHQRQFSDEQLRALFQRGGVIGAACDCWMLKPGWLDGASNASVSLAAVAEHIDYVCQLAGNSRHAAIGSDLDGGYGREQSPHDLDTIADLQKLAPLLAGRGYAQADIAAIMYGNWVRLLGGAWAR